METDRFIADDGIEIAFYRWDPVAPIDAPVVLLHHGFIANAHLNWELTGVVDALVGAGRRVVAHDARGHGRSDKPHDPSFYGEQRMATDVMTLASLILDRSGETTYDLVGYSMGAITALLAAGRDDRIRRLVVGGVGAGVVDLGGVDTRVMSRIELAEALEAGVASDAPDIADPSVTAFLSFVEASGGDRLALAAQARSAHAGSMPLQKIRADTMLLVGADDPLANEPDRLAAAIDRCELTIVAGDHLGAVVDAEFSPSIVRFLSR